MSIEKETGCFVENYYQRLNDDGGIVESMHHVAYNRKLLVSANQEIPNSVLFFKDPVRYDPQSRVKVQSFCSEAVNDGILVVVKGISASTQFCQTLYLVKENTQWLVQKDILTFVDSSAKSANPNGEVIGARDKASVRDLSIQGSVKNGNQNEEVIGGRDKSIVTDLQLPIHGQLKSASSDVISSQLAEGKRVRKPPKYFEREGYQFSCTKDKDVAGSITVKPDDSLPLLIKENSKEEKTDGKELQKHDHCESCTKVCVIYNPGMLKHRSTSEQNECPDRVRLIMKKLKDEGLLKRCNHLIGGFAEMDDVLAIHSREYIQLLGRLPWKKSDRKELLALCSKNKKPEAYFGDVYTSKGTKDAAFLAAGAVIKGCDAVLDGLYECAVAIIRPPGHHALPDLADGYCFTNNASIAAEYALKKKAQKNVAIFDMDVHHGNGTQAIFYGRKDVLVFSVHSSSLTYPEDDGEALNRTSECLGDGEGVGYNINVNLPGGYTDADMLKVLEELFIPVATEFQPDLVIISAGYDAVQSDPLGDACLSKACYATIVNMIRKINTGRLVLALEGGYDLKALPECVSYTVRSLLGDKDVLLQDVGDARPTTTPVVSELKEQLRTYWQVFRNEPTG